MYLQPDWRSSAVPVQPFMSRVGRVSDGTCTKRKMFDLPRKVDRTAKRTVCPLCLAPAPQENVQKTQGRPQSTPGDRSAFLLLVECRSCSISSDFTSLLHAETTKYNPYGSRILQPLTQNLPSRLSSNFEELLSRSLLGRPVMGLRIGEKLIEY